MKKLFNTVAFVLLSVLASITCAQPQSQYIVDWQDTEAEGYTVFLWQGSDTLACPFVEGQNYKDSGNDISSYIQMAVVDTTTTLMLANDGQHVRIGIVAFNSATQWSVLAVSAFYKKATVPTAPAFINIRLL